jgi:surfeit locus 1 family protein
VTLGRKDWALLAVAVAVAGVCARLGVWQLDRLSQRRARNAVTAARLERPPIELGLGPVAAESVAQRRLQAAGVYDYARERVRPVRAWEGVPGVAIVTPLRLADGSAVFVDRGWAPSVDGLHVALRDYREMDTVTVTGLGVRMPRSRSDLDPAQLADSFPYPLVPFGIQQLPSDAPTMLRRWPAPVLDDGPHVGYAVQWFSFATIVLVGTAVLLRTSRKSVEEKRQGQT